MEHVCKYEQMQYRNMFLNDLWYKDDLRFQAETQPDWCLGASRCGGNALSRDGLLRSTPGWWDQQYHGDPWCIFGYESHICPFVPRGNHAIPQNALRGHNAWKMGWYLQTLATPSVMTSREPDPIWEGGISSLTMGFPVLATAIIQEMPLSASALTPEVRAQSRFGHHWWDPFARTGAPIWSIGGWCFSSCFFLFVFSLFVSSFSFQSILVSWCTYDTCDTI